MEQLEGRTEREGKRGTIHPLLATRRSPYAFSTRPVEAENLRALFEAARWAPSSYNEQPWRFIVATREEPTDYVRVLETLVEGNRTWAQNAPVLTLAVARLDFNQSGRPNRHALYDLGQAVAHLSVEATARGLAVHQMGGFDPARARELFNIPAGYEPVAALAIGYPGTGENLPDSLRKRDLAPRSRKQLGEVVFSGTWAQPHRVAAGRNPASEI